MLNAISIDVQLGAVMEWYKPSEACLDLAKRIQKRFITNLCWMIFFNFPLAISAVAIQIYRIEGSNGLAGLTEMLCTSFFACIQFMIFYRWIRETFENFKYYHLLLYGKMDWFRE
jgi:hypothetical protein